MSDSNHINIMDLSIAKLMAMKHKPTHKLSIDNPKYNIFNVDSKEPEFFDCFLVRIDLKKIEHNNEPQTCKIVLYYNMSEWNDAIPKEGLELFRKWINESCKTYLPPMKLYLTKIDQFGKSLEVSVLHESTVKNLDLYGFEYWENPLIQLTVQFL